MLSGGMEWISVQPSRERRVRGQFHVEMHAECDYNNNDNSSSRRRSTDGGNLHSRRLCPLPSRPPQFSCVALVIIYSSIAEECGASCGVSGEENSSGALLAFLFLLLLFCPGIGLGLGLGLLLHLPLLQHWLRTADGLLINSAKPAGC